MGSEKRRCVTGIWNVHVTSWKRSSCLELLRSIILTYLYIPYYFHKITRTGAFNERVAQVIRESMPATCNPLKKSLWKNYVKQYHETSCSVASVATVVNGLGKFINGQAEEITQMDLLDKVNTGNWKKRMGPGGDNGKRGLPLALFGEVVRESLETFHIPFTSIEIVDPRKASFPEQEKKERLQNRLQEFETLGNGVVIAHFNQGAFVPEMTIPHISPVGGYDVRTDRVTVLDVDRYQSGPYSIPFERFYRGMSNWYPRLFRFLGLSNGGYVYIRL